MPAFSLAIAKTVITEIGKETGKLFSTAFIQGAAGQLAKPLLASGGAAVTAAKAPADSKLELFAQYQVVTVRAEISSLLFTVIIVTVAASIVWRLLSSAIEIQDPQEALRKPRSYWFLGLGATLTAVILLSTEHLTRIWDLTAPSAYGIVLFGTAMTLFASMIFWLGSVPTSRRALRAGLPFGHLLLSVP